MKTARTKVSKRSKGIDAIVNACFPGWSGRRLLVVEATPEWERIAGRCEHVTVWRVDLAATWPTSVESLTTPAQPTADGYPVPSRIPHGGALFIHSRLAEDRYPRYSGEDLGVEIVIPAGSIDADTLMVAIDALLGGDKRKASETLAQCGVYAGLALALAEARAKVLTKGEAAAAHAEAA